MCQNQLEKLKNLAATDSWTEIDKKLPELANKEFFVKWARSNLSNQESSLRDLAASILEITDCALNDSDLVGLIDLMRERDSQNPYPSFRAACALANHGKLLNPEQRTEVLKKLNEFLADSDVGDIASGYCLSLSE